MNILVTGGAGFIGSNVCDEYRSLGHKVFVVDNLSNSENSFLNADDIFYKRDIYSDDLESIFKENRIDVINHHAAQINLRDSIVNPINDLRINVEGTLNLLQLAVRYKVNKFIFASSGGAIYGEQEYFPADEKHIVQPISPYGISKATIEKYLNFYNSFFGLNYVVLRYSNAFGDRQGNSGESGVVSIFIKNILSGKPSTINGEGTNTRDYIYVKDIVKANVKALNYGTSDVFNISSGIETDLNSLAEQIKQLSDPGYTFLHTEGIRGEQCRSCLDNTKAKKLLDWSPEFTLKEGLELTYKWFKEN